MKEGEDFNEVEKQANKLNHCAHGAARHERKRIRRKGESNSKSKAKMV